MPGILALRLKGMGDIVHLIPSLERLRFLFPDQTIGLLAQTPFGEIVPPSLRVEIFHLPPKATFWQTLRLVRSIRKFHFDTALDFFGNPRTALISVLSGIPRRCGFDYQVRRHAYQETFHPPDSNRHLTELFGEFLDHFGFRGPLSTARLEVSPQDRHWGQDWLKRQNIRRPLLGVNPHTTYPSKCWPPEHFQAIIARWYHETGGSALVFHGPGEESATQTLLRNTPPGAAISHPPLKLARLLALLGEPDLFLTGDTGPMNLAWALGTPTVALFGPTTRRAVAPKGDRHLIVFHPDLDCLECHREVCQDGRCMKDLSPGMVWKKICQKYPGVVARP